LTLKVIFKFVHVCLMRSPSLLNSSSIEDLKLNCGEHSFPQTIVNTIEIHKLNPFDHVTLSKITINLPFSVSTQDAQFLLWDKAHVCFHA